MDYSDLDELVTDADQDPDFDQAAEFLKQHHHELLPDDLLELYSYFKQGTAGDCDVPKPGIFQIQGRAKWGAWNGLRGTPKTTARGRYTAKLTSLFPDWRDDRGPHGGPAVSRPRIDDVDADRKTIADFVRENSPELGSLLKSLGPEINELDESGLGLIHWCADRGHLDSLQVILGHPEAEVDLRDEEGQTALHYASSCGHLECVKLLLERGGDREALDGEGNSVADVAFDQSLRDFIQNL